jgi:predicted acetyltransferase
MVTPPPDAPPETGSIMTSRAARERIFEVASAGHVEPLGDVLAHAFGFPANAAAEWFTQTGAENVYAYRDGEEVLGGMLFAPMGQWFGGRSIPTCGVAGVGMTVERRGTGEGADMMRAALREMRRRGAAISTLYPSTVPFYRKVGYERAGARFMVSFRPSELPTRGKPDGLVVAKVPAVETPALKALQSRWASRHAGALDRGPYVWRRALLPPREPPATTFAIRRGSALVGHLAVLNKTFDGHDTQLDVVDACADDGAAIERILQILAGYRSIAANVRWPMHLPSLFSMSLADRTHEVRLVDHWLVRVLDAHAALRLRGYPKLARVRVALALEDPLFPEHHGRFELDVEGGTARVEPGAGSGPAVEIGPRGLAALFAGFMSASDLGRLGLLAGDEASLAALDSAFLGPLPTLAEAF